MTLRPMAALAALLLFASAAHAGAAEELISAINKCAAIADDAARHACYDQLPTLVKSLTPVAAAEARQLAAPPPPPATDSASGLFDLFADVPVPANHIAATVVSFTYSYGLFILTLDNGQVWRQVVSNGDTVPLHKDEKTEVKIWASPFGDYNLRITGYHRLYKVRRIK